MFIKSKFRKAEHILRELPIVSTQYIGFIRSFGVSLVERLNDESVIDMKNVTNYKYNYRLAAKCKMKRAFISVISERNKLIISFESEKKHLKHILYREWCSFQILHGYSLRQHPFLHTGLYKKERKINIDEIIFSNISNITYRRPKRQ